MKYLKLTARIFGEIIDAIFVILSMVFGIVGCILLVIIGLLCFGSLIGFIFGGLFCLLGMDAFYDFDIVMFSFYIKCKKENKFAFMNLAAIGKHKKAM